MRNILLVLLLGLPAWLFAAGSTDSKGKECVLVVSSTSTHRFSTEKTFRFVESVAKKADQDMDILVTQLDESGINSLAEMDSARTAILNSTGGRRPKLVLLLGFYSYVFCDDFNDCWPDVPLLLAGERDFTGPKERLVNHEPVRQDEHILLSDLRKRLNLTYLQANSYPYETLHLMRRLMPQMNTIYYISDGCYSCLQSSHDIQHIVSDEFPGMTYRHFSSDSLSTDELLITLAEADRHTTGSIYSSWSKWNNEGKDAVMEDYFFHTVSSLDTPLFTLRNFGTDNWKGCLGGYFTDGQTYRAKLFENTYSILCGTAPRDIPVYSPKKGVPTFNYNALNHFNLDLDKCPVGSVFYNRPDDIGHAPIQWFRSNVWTGIMLVLTIFVFILYIPIRLICHLLSRKREERKMQERIRGIINTMPLLYMYQEMITDENGVIIDTIYRDVNKCFTDLLFKREECIGKIGSTLFLDSMPIFLKASNLAKQSGKAINFQYYYPVLQRYYDIMVRPSEEGRFMEYFCMDCTELHNAEKALRSMNKKMNMALETTHVSAWKWELDTHTIHCQRFIRDANGDSRQHDIALTEEKMYSFIVPEDYDRIHREAEELISGEKENLKTEYRTVQSVNGQPHIEWMEVRATVGTKDEDGKPLTLVGTRQIITHRKEMEEELIKAKVQAEEANRLKSAFLANMSHEIRTPLNAIVGFSGLLVNAENESERNEYAGIIESNSDLLLQLVGDILDLSKIEAGTMEFVHSEFDLNKLMTDLHSVLQLHIPAENPVSLSCKLGLEHCVIRSERNRLTQLITNLVNNAIKFTEKGSISFGYEKRGDMLYFSVEDTGFGIAEDKQKEVFNRFVKLNSFKQGTGLGLPICKSIVETLGGEIGVKSKLDKGSTFYFTIPYHPAEETQKSKCDPKEMVKVAAQKANILVAEDNESNYKLINAILGKNYNLFHAWNGREAVEMFSQCDPQLILMDINMPEMDGYEAANEIRKLSADVPILALTAYAYASDEERILSSGMNSYMSKPINMQQLKAQVESLIRRSFVFL